MDVRIIADWRERIARGPSVFGNPQAAARRRAHAGARPLGRGGGGRDGAVLVEVARRQSGAGVSGPYRRPPGLGPRRRVGGGRVQGGNRRRRSGRSERRRATVRGTEQARGCRPFEPCTETGRDAAPVRTRRRCGGAGPLAGARPPGARMPRRRPVAPLRFVPARRRHVGFVTLRGRARLAPPSRGCLGRQAAGVSGQARCPASTS